MILTAQKSNEFAERIRTAVEAALAEQKVSARRASMDVVGHDGLIRDIRAGRIPSADRIEALFAYLGLEAYFGPRRQPDNPALTEVIANFDPEDGAPTGYLTIPWAVPRSGAGSAPVAFARKWLEAHNFVPDFLQAAVPDIVTMDGLAVSDMVVLLDTRIGQRQGHGLFCFRDRGRLRVARLTITKDLTIIHGAHADEEPKILAGSGSASIVVLGRVVWLGAVQSDGRLVRDDRV